MGKVKVSKNGSGRIMVSFPYDPQLVEKVRTIEGRKWHKDERYWSFPNTDGTLEKILEVFEGEEIRIDPALKGIALDLQTTHPCPPHRWGREREGVKKIE